MNPDHLIEWGLVFTIVGLDALFIDYLIKTFI